MSSEAITEVTLREENMAYKAQQRLPNELTSERRLRESAEGGPGSGPRPGRGTKHKSNTKAIKVRIKQLSKEIRDHLKTMDPNGKNYMSPAADNKLGRLQDKRDRLGDKLADLEYRDD